MKFLAKLILGICSGVWYYFSWDYMVHTMPELLKHWVLIDKNHTIMVLVFLAGIFVLWILFWKLLVNQKKEKWKEPYSYTKSSVKERYIAPKLMNIPDIEPVMNSFDTDTENNNSDSSTIEHSLRSQMDVFEPKIEKISPSELGINSHNTQEESSFYNIEENMGENAFANVAKKMQEKKTPSLIQKKNNLRLIEGIGPKIETLLNDGWIYSYSDLSKSHCDGIKVILEKWGTRYALHNPMTWPKQALLAQNWEWDILREYQEKLVKGVEI